MKSVKLYLSALLTLCTVAFTSCEEDTNIGTSISKGEVTIEVDSLFSVTGESVRADIFDSRSSTLLLGRLAAEDYGTLECSFASQLMPAASLSIPDSIPLEDVSGMSLKFTYKKAEVTGDSLAPQQLAVYRLLKELPSDINNMTDLSGYYNSSSLLGTKSYTASTLGMSTALQNKATGTINIPLSPEFAREVVKEYRTNPATFATPSAFAKKFAGIYVGQTFGRGLVVNMTSTEFTTYYNYHREVTVVKDGVAVKVDSLITDSATLFSISPEVLSANLMRMSPAQSVADRVSSKECILQGPGGYNVKVHFPARQIIERYYKEDFNLSVVNSLTYEVPVRNVANDYGITRPPYLLMIKTSRLPEFFLKNQLPQEDDTDCFYAAYNSQTDSYRFTSLRPYIVELMANGGKVEDADEDFTLVPVTITTEDVGSVTRTSKVMVTACDLYIARPVLCRLDIPGSKVKLTYSRQFMK